MFQTACFVLFVQLIQTGIFNTFQTAFCCGVVVIFAPSEGQQKNG